MSEAKLLSPVEQAKHMVQRSDELGLSREQATEIFRKTCEKRNDMARFEAVITKLRAIWASEPLGDIKESEGHDSTEDQAIAEEGPAEPGFDPAADNFHALTMQQDFRRQKDASKQSLLNVAMAIA